MTIQNNFKDYILKSAANLKKRNLVIAFLLFVIVIIFLGITVLYFFQNYSSIRIYKFYGKSENYEINDGLLILSKEKIYFDVKGIVPEIDTIEIISEINNEKKSVYKGDCKNVLNDLYGYSSIISYKKFINDDEIPSPSNEEYYNVKDVQQSNTSSKMVLLEPRAYSESQQIVDYLKNRHAVVVNLKRVTPDQAKRIIDYLSGALYAIKGDIQKLGNGIFLCTPSNVGVEGKMSDGEKTPKGSKKDPEDYEW